MGFLDFPASLLGDDEDLVIDLRPHWLALVRPLLQTATIALALAIAFLYLPYSWGPWAFAAAIAAAVVAFLIWPARPMADWLSSHFVVTTDRVIRRSGLIGKQTMEIALERMTDVRTRQGIIERVVGAGDLLIESAGRLGPVTFEDVRDPEQVQRMIFERKEANEERRRERFYGSTAGATRHLSVADELAKLHRLRGLSVISEDEFQELKARLLERARTS